MFAYRLGLHTGHVDIDQMMGALSTDQLIEWMAYDSLEPFGEERADLRSAIIASTLTNLFITKGKKTSLTDFMPKFDQQAGGKRQSVEEMKSALMTMFPKGK